MKKLELLIPPPVVAAVIAALMWQIAPIVPSPAQLADHHIVLSSVVAFAGVISAVAGVFVVVKNKTTINPHSPQKTSHLVTSGIYRYTRNPMYVGMLLVLGGWGLYLSHIVPLLMPLLFVLYINRFQIIPEEQVLVDKFGDEFVDYMRVTHRWI